jgi:hypothetical protein
MSFMPIPVFWAMSFRFFLPSISIKTSMARVLMEILPELFPFIRLKTSFEISPDWLLIGNLLFVALPGHTAWGIRRYAAVHRWDWYQYTPYWLYESFLYRIYRAFII